MAVSLERQEITCLIVLNRHKSSCSGTQSDFGMTGNAINDAID